MELWTNYGAFSYGLASYGLITLAAKYVGVLATTYYIGLLKIVNSKYVKYAPYPYVAQM